MDVEYWGASEISKSFLWRFENLLAFDISYEYFENSLDGVLWKRDITDKYFEYSRQHCLHEWRERRVQILGKRNQHRISKVRCRQILVTKILYDNVKIFLFLFLLPTKTIVLLQYIFSPGHWISQVRCQTILLKGKRNTPCWWWWWWWWWLWMLIWENIVIVPHRKSNNPLSNTFTPNQPKYSFINLDDMKKVMLWKNAIALFINFLQCICQLSGFSPGASVNLGLRANFAKTLEEPNQSSFRQDIKKNQNQKRHQCCQNQKNQKMLWGPWRVRRDIRLFLKNLEILWKN